MECRRQPGLVHPPPLGNSTLDVVEVCYHPCNRNVHGSEPPNQALYILPAHTALRHQYVHQGHYFPNLALREGDCSHLRVNCTPRELLDTVPVTLSCQEFLQYHWVFGISR